MYPPEAVFDAVEAPEEGPPFPPPQDKLPPNVVAPPLEPFVLVAPPPPPAPTEYEYVEDRLVIDASK
jgi:hypothetical protein